MPLSKKLKANAMAAMYKTQSGFTMKRKSSLSALMGNMKNGRHYDLLYSILKFRNNLIIGSLATIYIYSKK